jgi:purine-binding chemotaxis protein CheW
VQLVSFRLGQELFGVDILKVQEINRMAEITKLPEAPSYCEGVINLRGKVIPVLDLRKKFEMDSKEWDKNSRIIVCSVDHTVVGMVVDAVDEVLRISSDIIEPAPERATSVSSDYITGVAKLDNSLLIFLDISKIAREAQEAVQSDMEGPGSERGDRGRQVADRDRAVAINARSRGDTMPDSIEVIVARLRDVVGRLNGNTAELVSAAEEVLSSARRTVDAAEHMSKLTGEQGQQVGQVMTVVEETVTSFMESHRISEDTTKQLTEMVRTIQKETEQALRSVEAGVQVVCQGREMADQAGNSLNEVASISGQVMRMIEKSGASSGPAPAAKARNTKTVSTR